MFEVPVAVTLADITQTHSWADCVAEPHRLEAKAFCGNCLQILRAAWTPVYRVRGLVGLHAEIKTKSRECPDCGHALFWSRNYKEFNSANDDAD